jgi:hypothetical protein
MLYIVKLSPYAKNFSVNGITSHVVIAESEDDALDMVKSFYTSNKAIWNDAEIEEIAFDETSQSADIADWSMGVLINNPAGTEIVAIDVEGAEATTLADFSITAGGTSFAVGNEVSVSGGTGDPAILRVATVTDGTITAVEVLTPGSYSVPPDSPAALAGGDGTGATIAFEELDGVFIDQVAAAAVTALNAHASIANAAYVPKTGILTVAGTADSLGTSSVEAFLVSPGDDSQRIVAPMLTITDSGTVTNAALSIVLDTEYKPPVIFDTFKSV